MGTPWQYPEFAIEIGLENFTAKESLRLHVAAVHLGNYQYAYYLSKAYPEYYKKLTESKP